MLQCQPGSFSAAGATECSPCAPGNYSADAGQGFNCFSCVAGSYAEDAGLAQCMPCPVGTYSTKEAAKSASDCTSCPEGLITDRPGAGSVNLCVAKPGHVMVRGVAVECPEGAVCNGTAAEVTELVLRSGYWRATVGSLNVQQCPVTQFCVGGQGGGLQLDTNTADGRASRSLALTTPPVRRQLSEGAAPTCIQGHSTSGSSCAPHAIGGARMCWCVLVVGVTVCRVACLRVMLTTGCDVTCGCWHVAYRGPLLHGVLEGSRARRGRDHAMQPLL